jgi:hypothetical protein
MKPKHIRGLGTPYLRKGSTVWWVMYYVRGKRHRESSGSRNRTDALALLKKRIADAANGRPVGAQVEKTTLADLRTMLIDNYKANNRRSTRRAGEAFDHLLAYFSKNAKHDGSDALAIDITSDRVTAYIAHRQQQPVYKARTTASATINNELAMLRRAFNLARKAKRVISVPRSRCCIWITRGRAFSKPSSSTPCLPICPTISSLSCVWLTRLAGARRLSY